MVDACAAHGLEAFSIPFGDVSDPATCEARFRNAFLLGRAGAWTLHPSQIAIDGKTRDDTRWKQARVIDDLATQVAERDGDFAALYAS